MSYEQCVSLFVNVASVDAEVSPAKKPKLEPSGGSGDHINAEDNSKGIYLFILFNGSTWNI